VNAATPGQAERAELEATVRSTINAGRDHAETCQSCVSASAAVMELADAYAKAAISAPQPAPDAELGRARAAMLELLGLFHGVPGGWQSSRTSMSRLGRIARSAGVSDVWTDWANSPEQPAPELAEAHATIDRQEQQLLDAGDEIGQLRRQLRAVKALADRHALGDTPRADLARAVLGELGES